MMRDNVNGYSAWREIDGCADEIKRAVEEKDEALAAQKILEALWIMCNEHTNENEHKRVFCAGDMEFLFDYEDKADAMADIIDLAFGDSTYSLSRTGYYDPEEDERFGCVDEFTGMWYASWG